MDNYRNYQISRPTKVLVAIASGVVVIMLGTMLVVKGFWADNFHRVFHKIGFSLQTLSIPYGARFKEFAKNLSSPPATKSPIPPGTESRQPKGLEKQVPLPTSNNEKLGSPETIPPPLRETIIEKQAPASSRDPSISKHIASPPLPEGGARLESGREISPDGKQKLSIPPQAKGDIKPKDAAEPKPPTEMMSPKEGAGEPRIGEPGPSPAPSPVPSTSPKVASAPTELIAQKGDVLNRIVGQKYPENRKLGLAAIILANPQITDEDKVYSGQVLYLPEIHFAKQQIRLKDHRFFVFYGDYLSAGSLKEVTAWLEDKKVDFVVRDTKDSKGNVLHRVFLGGYETEAELEQALGNVNTKFRINQP
jgi:hypothetical protein